MESVLFGGNSHKAVLGHELKEPKANKANKHKKQKVERKQEADDMLFQIDTAGSLLEQGLFLGFSHRFRSCSLPSIHALSLSRQTR